MVIHGDYPSHGFNYINPTSKTSDAMGSKLTVLKECRFETTSCAVGICFHPTTGVLKLGYATFFDSTWVSIFDSIFATSKWIGRSTKTWIFR